jgi:hypothetical protein
MWGGGTDHVHTTSGNRSRTFGGTTKVKKILSILFAGVLTVGMVACKSETNVTPEGESTTVTESVSETVVTDTTAVSTDTAAVPATTDTTMTSTDTAAAPVTTDTTATSTTTTTTTNP